jgi:hypothetical protein
MGCAARVGVRVRAGGSLIAIPVILTGNASRREARVTCRAARRA